MNRLVHLATLVATVSALATPADSGTEMSREALVKMSEHYRYFIMLPDADGQMRYLYADDGPHLHVYRVDERVSVLDWETNVGSPVRGLQLVTTDDGSKLIVVATVKGKIFAYGAGRYQLVNENLMEPFTDIQAMVVGELDRDSVKEVVVLGTKEGEEKPHLFVYDGLTRAIEWRSQETFNASEMLVANLDDDIQPEIILNSGYIIDSRFRTIEIDYIKEGGFGTRLRLLDINGDGMPEIFGNTIGDQLRVYDPYAERRLW